MSKREQAIEYIKSRTKDDNARDSRSLIDFYKLANKKTDLIGLIKAKKMVDTGFDFHTYDLQIAYEELNQVDRDIKEY